ncbi:MAG TPA: hypothetical protein DET40_14740 [Lentisphaeria bacterium]|nr:MAG: hypothetical protein A2X45_05910 [Lentisphaerae bacterium GWF2_50_93]HCE44795.1 hypothetical protein [Lentisphaeria bacterium]
MKQSLKDRIKKYRQYLLAVALIILILAFLSTNILIPCPETREPSENYLTENTEAVKKNVRDVDFWITTDSTRYFIGEEIPIKLHFKSREIGKYRIDCSTYDRSGRFDENKFVVDGTENGCVDPLKRVEYFSMSGGLGRGNTEDFEKVTKEYPLNDYVRFDKPGTYYLYCNTELVSTLGKSISLSSLPLKIRISESRKLNTFFKSHAYALMLNFQNENLRRYALDKLRYIGNHKAVDVFVQQLCSSVRNESASSYRGIIASRDYEYAKKALIELSGDPDAEIGDSHIYIFELITLPQELIDQIGINLGAESNNGYSLRALKNSRKISAWMNGAEKTYKSCIYENIRKYSNKKKAAACYMLMVKGPVKTSGEEEINEYAQKPEMRKLTASTFSLLNNMQQLQLLGKSWENISCREFEPVLEKLVQELKGEPENHEDLFSVREFSKLRLLQLQGKEKEARELLFADMKRKSSVYNRFYLRESVLDGFMDEPLPDMDDVFLKRLKENRGNTIVPCLIRKYATRKIFPEIIKVLDDGEQGQQKTFDIELFGYLMKYDRDIALGELKKSLLRGDNVWTRDLFKMFPEDAGNLYLDILGEIKDEKAGSLLIGLAVYGRAVFLDRMIDKFEELSRKQVEGFRKTGEYKDCGKRGDFLVFLLDNENMQFTQVQKDRLFSLLTTEEKKVFEEYMQSISKWKDLDKISLFCKPTRGS